MKIPLLTRVHEEGRKIRANQWKYADYDGDGRTDLLIAIGDWNDYGWDNAFNSKGEWTRGPLHGFVYLFRNKGTTREPRYAGPETLTAGGKPIDVYGMPSPNLDDFDGDGDLDLICGEFVDKLTWFENMGTRTEPEYSAGRYLLHEGKPLKMSLCMITPVAVDWDRDGDVDLVVGQEDGRVALVENAGEVADRMPVFEPPRFFQQEAHEVKFGALATPVGFDWDGDGDDDIVTGNTEGHVGLIENLGGDPLKWAAPEYLEADGRPIRLVAGHNGSIQGPCEAKWGYTTLSVADWDHDGLADIVANSIWGKVHWYRNVGTRRSPKLAAAEPIEVEWSDKPPKPEWNWWDPEGNELATQWRTTPAVADLTGDGLVDLVMLDHEGFLALYERKKADGKLVLLPPKRVFQSEGPSVFNSRHDGQNKEPGPLRLNDGVAGRSGRRKLCFADWDGDGRADLLVNSRNVDWLRNLGERNGHVVLQPMGPLAARRLAGHTTSPTVVDWNGDGVPDLLVGAEDGFFYYLENPRSK
ncbi:MAG: FG-GAP repeat domain-containing protein [Planctomycetota bacterium]